MNDTTIIPGGSDSPPPASYYEGLPPDGLHAFRSTKRVMAGRIAEVCPAGCYVLDDGGNGMFRPYAPNMTARYTPVVGDWWIVYPDGYQSISPKAAFEDGYVAEDAA